MKTQSIGLVGSEVTMLQRALSYLNFNLTIDGQYGNATKATVIDFQNVHGLTPDGIAGTETWSVLDDMVPQGMDISHLNGFATVATVVLDELKVTDLFAALPGWKLTFRV